MVRIGGSTDPSIVENDYFSKSGHYRVDREASPIFMNSLMYKLCYYKFGEVFTEGNRPAGYDRVRQAEIGNKNIELKYLEEAYTTQHWMVRIYRLKDVDNRGGKDF